MPDVVSSVPDAQGRFGPYGGRFVPESLMAALDELEQTRVVIGDENGLLLGGHGHLSNDWVLQISRVLPFPTRAAT